MKRTVFAVPILLLLVVLVFVLLPKNEKDVSNRPVLSATILPLSMILKSVAGDDFTVVTVLPAGVSPHTFEPTPQSIGALTDASVLFAVGHGLDDWSMALAESAGISKRYVVDADIGILDANPHYFLSPLNAAIIAKNISSELSDVYPEKTQIFEHNATAFGISMDAMTQQAKRNLSAVGNPPLATFHGAWEYFAKDLGLSVAAVFEEYPGKDPTPVYLKEFERKIRGSGVKVIFAEPQFGTALIEPIAQDLGVTIRTLDPEGSVTGAKTYEELIMKNVDVIVKAQSK